ncbi:S-phase kinase-associated protein 1-like [Drosophila serrata]|uniref:S-phase kinase-associated protein 1-like n=1 Tax=Drosophila serrata TaxID=7274 RepID=UPI000A1CF5C8|nr:S-phase kinase-associated protein 1-like [Drosophila serrata]
MESSEAKPIEKMSVQLKSQEGEIFNVPHRIIKCATNVIYAMKTFQVQGPFPLPGISSNVLHKIIAWADYHKDDPEPMETDSSEDEEYEVVSWDAKFLNVDSTTMSEIKMGARCLGIEGLQRVCEALTKTVKKKKT